VSGVLLAVSVLALCLALAACSSHEPVPRRRSSYTVREGDTLYSIAFRHGLDYRDVARWNHIDNSRADLSGPAPRALPTGQGATAKQSRLQRPVRAARPGTRAGGHPRPPPQPAGPPVDWCGPRAATSSRDSAIRAPIGKGIDIGGARGDEVRAAAAGRVVYTGSGLIGTASSSSSSTTRRILSAYGHNDALFVEQGATCSAGQACRDDGEGPGKRPLLHFEIRSTASRSIRCSTCRRAERRAQASSAATTLRPSSTSTL
jgi:lipoprotein NlpD